MMGRIWAGMILASLLCGAVLGRGAETAAAVTEGAGAGIELALSLTGVMCLWSGVMEVMRDSGLGERLTGLLRPALGRLYPEYAGEDGVMEDIAANLSANLLGLGSAATPPGVRAAAAMARGGRATDGMCMLVVCNTASVQLIPATVAAVRSAAGSGAPFEILPAVWLSSALSLGAGILACRLLRRLWRD